MGRREGELQVTVVDEFEDWLHDASFFERLPQEEPARKARGLIRMDDLLRDINRQRQTEGRGRTATGQGLGRRRVQVSDESEDSEEEKITALNAVVEECEKRLLCQEAPAKKASKWGRRLFGPSAQVPAPPVGSGVLEMALQVMPDREPLELLSSGDLLVVARLSGTIDHLFFQWVFHHMAFSSDSAAEESASSMLCQIADPAERFSPKWGGWMPDGGLFVSAFRCLGYEEDAPPPGLVGSADVQGGCPRNVRSLLRVLAAFSSPPAFATFSVTDAERLVLLLLGFVGDRDLQHFLPLVSVCLEQLLDWFSVDDWPHVLERIASRLAEGGANNLVFVKGYLTFHCRVRQVQSQTVLCHLQTFTKTGQIRSAADVVSLFKNVSLRKGTAFLELYNQLVLADLWLWQNLPTCSKDATAMQAWISFLRRCSTQIFCGDTRLHATKLRDWASFLCHKYTTPAAHETEPEQGCEVQDTGWII